MTPDEHRALRESLGDHAIGRLPRDEAAAVAAHLDGCAECRAELTEISSVLPALGRVDPAQLDRAPAPPPDLGDRIVAAARAEGREPGTRKRPRWLPVASAAAVAILVGGAVGYAVGDHDGIPREPVAVQAMDPAVEATAVAIPHTWGVEIVLDADGFRSGSTYRVVVEASDGREVGAGEFIGTGENPMVCNLNSSVLRSDASGFRVVDTGGATVLRGDLRST
ncbi:putative anti-sigma factor [Pseudonocardia sp. Ae168_Ps1]|uniref:anti-sigma factor family protein n=1 Tax=unclassified Pseudonocardia TaxID=2619320 RepID=UPI00094B71C0|nr:MULTISPECIES: zf-HC2 domain-containing protein [unclassified Pseudonocardia]OLL73516.1 putative anti-sigma factor [Pseudonocardia sp. Ae150A_Ps1]OLL79487.1 putative anti-sigma factor [Pseudonocardia sp. Ae168_Ps1]OLL86373.1 putative anti-sigma factor [Pseudonocardia sp. Ae263_Ps1]OLL93583.1 putative anti-sigma factor [Pseudonocardia sp. Ae356_Ps1]